MNSSFSTNISTIFSSSITLQLFWGTEKPEKIYGGSRTWYLGLNILSVAISAQIKLILIIIIFTLNPLKFVNKITVQ